MTITPAVPPAAAPTAAYKADVAIVGYGPVGQFLALKLARAGHAVVVLERFTEIYPMPRAVHFDDEIGRLLQSIGFDSDTNPVVEEFDAIYTWRNAAHQNILELDWRGRGPSGWQRANFFCQPELEAELHALVAAEPNVTLLRGWDVAGIAEGPDAVTLSAAAWRPEEARRHETVEVTARYVVGCDGANSTVRRHMGVPVHDLGFEFDWLIVDVNPHEPISFDPPAVQWCNPEHPTTIVPGGPGRRRWEFMRLPHESIEQLNSTATAWKRLEAWDLHPGNATLERHAVYTFRALWAQRWRAGRLLLAGDAAHLMPPFAGQGMCSGLRDAMNLAWRLDDVLTGRSGDALLDSYDTERIQHVRHFIEFSMGLGQVICVTDPDAAAARDEAMLAAMADPTLAPPPPPPPRLGAGVRGEHPAAGLLSIQARIRVGDREGLFDDVLEPGWYVVSTGAVEDGLPADIRAWAAERGVRFAVLDGDGPGGIADIEGQYAAWLTDLDAEAVVVRPDFYVYDAGARTDVAGQLANLRAQLQVQAATAARL